MIFQRYKKMACFLQLCYLVITKNMTSLLNNLLVADIIYFILGIEE